MKKMIPVLAAVAVAASLYPSRAFAQTGGAEKACAESPLDLLEIQLRFEDGSSAIQTSSFWLDSCFRLPSPGGVISETRDYQTSDGGLGWESLRLTIDSDDTAEVFLTSASLPEAPETLHLRGLITGVRKAALLSGAPVDLGTAEIIDQSGARVKAGSLTIQARALKAYRPAEPNVACDPSKEACSDVPTNHRCSGDACGDVPTNHRPGD